MFLLIIGVLLLRCSLEYHVWSPVIYCASFLTCFFKTQNIDLIVKVLLHDQYRVFENPNMFGFSFEL